MGDENGSAKNQYMAAFVICMMPFSQGCILGWISPSLTLMSGPDTPLPAPLTVSEKSWIGSLMCLGAFLATPFFGWTTDRFGRKATVLASGVPYLLCWLLKLTWKTPTGIMVARLVGGAAGAAVFAATATYLVEIATVKTRGALGSLLIFNLNIGVVFMYAAGAYLSYGIVLCIMIAIPIVFVLLMTMMPETPMFLMKNDRQDKAVKAISWLRSLPEASEAVQKEVAAMKFDIDLSKTGSNKDDHQRSSWSYLFLAKSTLKAFLACISLFTVQSFMGNFAITTYSSLIFEQAGGTLPPHVNTIIVGLLQFLGSVVTFSLIERTGRKVLLVGSCGVNAACMLAIAIYFHLKEAGSDLGSLGWIPVTSLSLSVATFAMGIGSVPFILVSEIIPVQARSLASCLVMMWTWLTLFVISQSFEYLVALLGIPVVFGIFSAFSCVGVAITLFCLPETKGRSLEHIRSYYEATERLLR